MTFLPFVGRGKHKKSLAAADEQIRSLKKDVRALEESNQRLTAELAEARQRADAVAEGERGSTETGPLSSEKERAQSPDNIYDDGEERRAQTTINELTAQNKGLEAKVTSLTETKRELEARLAKKDGESGGGGLMVALDEMTRLNEELQTAVSSLSKEKAALETRLGKENNNSTASDTAQASSGGDAQTTIDNLTQRNQALEAHVATLSVEKDKLAARLSKEKNRSIHRRAEAKERRSKLKTKLASMTEKLKEDFGSDFDAESSQASETGDAEKDGNAGVNVSLD